MKLHLPHSKSDRPAFWIRRLLACVLILMGCTNLPAETTSSATKHFPKADRIRYDGHCQTIDGKDVFIRSAEFHYFRTPQELWRDRFQKIKEARIKPWSKEAATSRRLRA
jgi:hypothetical protein